jgi:hypothetical protein
MSLLLELWVQATHSERRTLFNQATGQKGSFTVVYKKSHPVIKLAPPLQAGVNPAGSKTALQGWIIVHV